MRRAYMSWGERRDEYLDHYRLLRRLGAGGNGVVFEAEDQILGRRVALKVLHPHVAERPDATERFEREARSMARLSHPHIVQVFALGKGHNVSYLAMELLDGGNLDGHLAEAGSLSMPEALDVLIPVISAVSVAHEAGIVHRDLKPSNIVFSTRGGRRWPKLVDFGLSKMLVERGDPLTGSDGLLGTAAYMAPELLRSSRAASYASDQYAIGVIIYRTLAGRLPFLRKSVYDLLEAIKSEPVKPPSSVVAGLPPGLDAIVLRAMDRDPSARFPSVGALGAALLPFAEASTREVRRRELNVETVKRTTGVCPSDDGGLNTTYVTLAPMSRRFGPRLPHASIVAVAGMVTVLCWANAHAGRTNSSPEQLDGKPRSGPIVACPEVPVAATAPRAPPVQAPDPDGARSVVTGAPGTVSPGATPPRRSASRGGLGQQDGGAEPVIQFARNGAPILP